MRNGASGERLENLYVKARKHIVFKRVRAVSAGSGGIEEIHY